MDDDSPRAIARRRLKKRIADLKDTLSYLEPRTASLRLVDVASANNWIVLLRRHLAGARENLRELEQ